MSDIFKELYKTLKFYADGEHHVVLSGKIDWEKEREQLTESNFVCTGETSRGAEHYVENGSKAQAILSFIQAKASYKPSKNSILEKIDTMIAYINEAYNAKNPDWKDSCWWASDLAFNEIKELLSKEEKILAWRNPETDDVVSDARKQLWLQNDGGYKIIAEKYTQPLKG